MIAALKIYRRERREREGGSDFANVEKAGWIVLVGYFGEHWCGADCGAGRRRRKWKSTREMKKKSNTDRVFVKKMFHLPEAPTVQWRSKRY